ncbi:asparagine synthase (glutamine-hydrolyzing) [Streptomyces sp. BH105]|uniref:asparagine synthase (glutamine-hydrolyzing) n=1 Tax=Streptomyces sp. BH105 TaxID=3410408 RepID=UPI003CE96DC3
MCGIAAIHSHHGSLDTECADGAAEGMLDRLAHRGPDDSGTRRVGGHTWLGHRRLSIVDLDGGHQPLGGGNGDDDWSLVCNGEIYNHEALREELPAEAFGSSSDSAAALAVLRTDGPAGLRRLRGMWALCAATPGGRFVAARDAIGVKPLYWARTETAVHFASELRAFDLDVQPAAEIFPPGHWWTPEDGLRRFAEPVPDVTTGTWGGVPEQVVEKATFEAVADSIRRHLMADVEVGVFLSGGLDSSLVAAIAAEEYARRGRRLKTFAVGTEDSTDLLAARDAAAFLGTEHHEAVLDAEAAARALDEVVGCVESFDASLIRSAVPNWFLSELASRHVKAVLTGEGADELFAGYGYYHERHAAPDALDAELRRTIGALHGLNLQRCDRVTMAHGLEARVPFLDRDVIAHAMSLPAQIKRLDDNTADGMEKGHLRRAFAGRLPEHLLWRRKSQFGTGSGAESVLSPLWDSRITDEEFAKASAEDGAPELRSKEELGYYRTFRAALPGVRPEEVLTRFATA